MLNEKLIRERIIFGIRDKRLSEQLQMDSELTLAKAIHKVRQWTQCGQTTRGKSQTWQKKEQKTVTQIEKGCRRCGRKNKYLCQDCPAKDVQCQKCQKKGHFAVSCHSSEAARLREVTENNSDTDREDCVFLGEIGAGGQSPGCKKWRI